MPESNHPLLISASCPGGLACQFKVQIASIETASLWQLVGSFRDRQTAGEQAARLCRSGQLARVLACRALPTAA